MLLSSDSETWKSCGFYLITTYFLDVENDKKEFYKLKIDGSLY